MRILRLVTLPLLLASLLLATCVFAPAAGSAERVPPKGEDGKVLVAPLTGTVDPVMLEFTKRVLARAKDDDYDAVVFEMDTPGGLSTSMDDIVSAIVNSKLPVYVYVSPSSSRAASAGVFITYAADVAAMAPGTNIGSATPINSNGESLPKDLRRKVLNDAVAKITELAKERGRDPKFAEGAIRKADNVGAREALRRNIINYIADDVPDLLEQSDGDTVKPKDLTLHLKDAKLDHMDVPLTLRVLKKLVDPNLLFLLFGAGVIGLAFELTHPGVVLPGVAGGVCLLLALFGLSVLPATGAGIALLLLAAALFAGEAVAPGGGAMGIGGAVALLLGAILLFDDSSGYGVSTLLALAVAVTMALFFGLVLRKAVQARRLQPTTSAGGMLGMQGIVRRTIPAGGPGAVFVDGEIWQARALQPIEPGVPVRVTRVEGLEVEVEPIPAAAPEMELE